MVVPSLIRVHLMIEGGVVMKRIAALTVAAATVAILSTGAQAADAKQGISAGDFMVRARGINVRPDVDNSELKLNGAGIGAGDVTIDNDTVPEVDFTYFVTENIGLELIAATTRHNVGVSGGVLAGSDLGAVSLLPPTLSVQYHFLPKGAIKPYVGAGLNYTHFYNAKGASSNGWTTEYDDNFGYAFQVGVDVAIADGWYLNADVKKLFISSDVTVHAGANTVTTTVDIDPWIIGLGVGYRF